MEFRRHLKRLRHWLWVLPLVTLLSAYLGYLATTQITPLYEARATLLVNASSTSGPPNYYNDSVLSQQLVKTYSQLASTPAVLQEAAAGLGLSQTPEQLEHSVSVQPLRDTQLFTVTARAADAGQARDLANAVAAVFIARQDRLAVDGVSSGVSVVQPALLPRQPIEPRPVLNVAMAGIFGFLLALGALFLASCLDATVKEPKDLEFAGIKVLGSVNRLSAIAHSGRDRPISRVFAEQPSAADPYHALRIRLESSSFERPPRTLLVSSTKRGDGRSTIAAGLALSFALSGKEVVVVDADFRSPALHRIFHLSNASGLSDLLQRHEPESAFEYAQPGPVAGLRVITSGPRSQEHTELLQSARLSAVLEHLAQVAELVLLDGPPALLADGLALAHHADATLLVVETRRARATDLCDLMETLHQSGAHIAGTVLNSASRRHADRGPRQREDSIGGGAAPVKFAGLFRVFGRWRRRKVAPTVFANPGEPVVVWRQRYSQIRAKCRQRYSQIRANRSLKNPGEPVVETVREGGVFPQ